MSRSLRISGWVATVVVAAGLNAGPGDAQGTLSALQTDMEQIARRARPSVVTVIALRNAGRRTAGAEQRVRTRVGSGVAVEVDVILTTASVAMGADRLVVQTANGLHAEAEVLGIDPILNLALLHSPTVRLPFLKFAPASDAQVGSWVLSLGTSYRAQPTQSVGNVAYRYQEPSITLLQLTNTVYPGNSGAAALNPRGELIGIVQGELAPPEPADQDPDAGRRPGGASFVLPVEHLRPAYESLRSTGRVRHGFLGVRTRAMSVTVGEGASRTPLGALVEGVVAGGPADRVGVRTGDLLVAFRGERVEYPEQLARWVAGSAPGTGVDLVWVRDEIAHGGRAVLGESSEPFPAWITPHLDLDVSAPPLRIAEIERQIQRLNGELNRLKGPTDRRR